MLFQRFRHLDWVLLLATIPVLGAGLVSMYSFSGGNNYFEKQLLWIGISFALAIGLSLLDLRLLRKTNTILSLVPFFFCTPLAVVFGRECLQGRTRVV